MDPQDWTSFNGLDCKYVVFGDIKHTPQEIEISPEIITSAPGELIFMGRCVYSPYFLPKG